MHPLLDSIMNLYVVGVILPFDSLLTLFGCVFLREVIRRWCSSPDFCQKFTIDMFSDLWEQKVNRRNREGRNLIGFGNLHDIAI